MFISLRVHARWLVPVLAVVFVLTSARAARSLIALPSTPIGQPPALTAAEIDWTAWKGMVKPYVTPKPRVARHRAVYASGGSVWDAISRCESGGNWASSGGTFEGGLQFLHSTWVSAGGRRYAEHAYQATREQQIAIAQSWLAKTSWAQWPACSRKLGLR